MKWLKKLEHLLFTDVFDSEIFDLVGRSEVFLLNRHLQEMQGYMRAINRLKEGDCPENVKCLYNEIISSYLEHFKTYRGGIPQEIVTRSQLFALDNKHRELEQQYNWFFKKGD